MLLWVPNICNMSNAIVCVLLGGSNMILCAVKFLIVASGVQNWGMWLEAMTNVRHLESLTNVMNNLHDTYSKRAIDLHGIPQGMVKTSRPLLGLRVE